MSTLSFLDDLVLTRLLSLLETRDYLKLLKASRRFQHLIGTNRLLLRKSSARNVELRFYEFGVTIGLYNGRGCSEGFEVRPNSAVHPQLNDGFHIEGVVLAGARPRDPEHICFTTINNEETLKILFRHVTRFHTYSTIRLFCGPLGCCNPHGKESLVSALAEAVREEGLSVENLGLELSDTQNICTLDEQPILELVDAAEIKNFSHDPPRHGRSRSIQWGLSADFFSHSAVQALESFYFAGTLLDRFELTDDVLLSWSLKTLEISGSRTRVTARGIHAWLVQACEAVNDEVTRKLGLTLEGDEDILWEQIIGDYSRFLTRKGDLKMAKKRVRLSFQEHAGDSNRLQRFTHVLVTVRSL